ncbi:Adiponectin receptor protein [Echinococcus granulosus]|nr:Adiponectin receptor protein [Echinococcus granulosus]
MVYHSLRPIVMAGEGRVDASLSDGGSRGSGVDTTDGVDATKFGCTESIFNHDFASLAQSMAHSAEEFVRQVWLRGWQLVQFAQLPVWMKDNDFLVRGHRPALNSYWSCAKSIFRIHTETGNIWTHLLGCVLFITIWTFFVVFAPESIQWQDKLVFSAFFLGAVVCLGFSCIFHTLSCHSLKVSRFANKLDYAGIAILTIGSFVPYLYYTFYCDFSAMVGYLSLICVLGVTSICVSMLDVFASPRFRSVRAGSFIGLGLSGVIPATHYAVVVGWNSAVEDGSLGWLIFMAVLYISGAVLYALRIPERCFPGYCDIWFQSHQIFHVFVVAAATVHYYGVAMISNYRLSRGDCKPTPPINFTHT